jgi:hypothetical protein
MARSYKTNPAGGVTTARSEKRFKSAQHRSERRTARVALRTGRPLPDPREFGNRWCGPKDGRAWYGSDCSPELLRK